MLHDLNLVIISTSIVHLNFKREVQLALLYLKKSQADCLLRKKKLFQQRKWRNQIIYPDLVTLAADPPPRSAYEVQYTGVDTEPSSPIMPIRSSGNLFHTSHQRSKCVFHHEAMTPAIGGSKSLFLLIPICF